MSAGGDRENPRYSNAREFKALAMQNHGLISADE